LEPIMKVEVVTPEDYTGSVIGDLNSRRGQIQGQDMRGNANVINAMVPLANMFGYVSNLRSMSQGRATFTMQFDHYEHVPQAVAAKTQAKFAGSRGRANRNDANYAGFGVKLRRIPEEPSHGEAEIRTDEAALQCWDDRSRGPRQDDIDGRHDEGVGGEGLDD